MKIVNPIEMFNKRVLDAVGKSGVLDPKNRGKVLRWRRYPKLHDDPLRLEEVSQENEVKAK